MTSNTQSAAIENSNSNITIDKNNINKTNIINMPTKNANDFKYHKFKRENQFTDLQVSNKEVIIN